MTKILFGQEDEMPEQQGTCSSCIYFVKKGTAIGYCIRHKEENPEYHSCSEYKNKETKY